MNRIRFCTLLVLALFFGAAHAAKVPSCSQQQLLGYVPDTNDVKAHRQFAAPVISYPYGTKMLGWGWPLTVRVDEAGQIVCYEAKDEVGRAVPMNAARRVFLDGLSAWRYAPFAKDGRAAAAIVTEQVAEQELPAKHLPLPDVPLADVRIALSRSSCLGSCPDYQVDIRGDGLVVYQGKRFVDVIGRHEYTVPVADVAKLVDSLRAKDIWSLRSRYIAPILDVPGYQLILTMGGQAHKLGDNVGQEIGMPAVVSEFEDEVDAVARSARWTHLSQESLDHLKVEGFHFDSRDGADMLARAVVNSDSHDDDAMLELVKLGAPLDGYPFNFNAPWLRQQKGNVLNDALSNHRSLALVDAMIAKGALMTNGKPDQDKIDAAFREAIKGGRLAQVQRIWAVAGTQPHPSLSFKDSDDGNIVSKVRKQSPVTLLLSQPYGDDHWDGFAIAKWLAEQGCDLKAHAADGDTLLHIAAQAGDVDFVRYLLGAGLNVLTPGKDGSSALDDASNEDVAMILLQAGAHVSRTNDAGHLLEHAQSWGWTRVVAWLKAHHED